MKKKSVRFLSVVLSFVLFFSMVPLGPDSESFAATDLLPLFSSGTWEIHEKASITGNDELTLDATNSWQNNIYYVPITNEETYTLTVDNPKNGTVFGFEVDANGSETWAFQSTATDIAITFKTKPTTKKIRLGLSSGEKTSGSFVFRSPTMTSESEAEEVVPPISQLEARDITSTSITLSYVASPGATSYEINRDGKTIYEGNKTTYTDEGLTAATPYHYEVTALSGEKRSEAIAIDATTKTEETAPEEPKESTSSHEVSVESFGAIANDGKDDTEAFKKALEGNQNVTVGPGTFHVSASLDVASDKIRGAGEGATTILAKQNAPIFIVTGQFNEISDMRLQYEGWENKDFKNRNVIQFTGNISMSTFQNLHMVSMYRGFYIDDNPNKVSAAFSNIIRNIYIFGYEKNAIHLDPPIGGLSGSIIENIYTNNGATNRSANDQQVVTFLFGQIAEMKLTQLNCEWANVESCFDIEYAREVVMDAIHIEGVDLYGDRFFRIGNDTHVNIRGLRMEDLRIHNNAHIFQLTGGAALTVDGLDEDRSHVYNGGLKVLQATGDNNTATITGYETSQFKTIGDKDKKNSDGSPVLKRYNDEFMFIKEVKSY